MGPQWPCGHGLCPLPASLAAQRPISFSAQEHLCSFFQQGPQGWSVCPAGLVGVPYPWCVGMGTMTATPLQPCGWNAREGHLKMMTLPQKWADKKGLKKERDSSPPMQFYFLALKQKLSAHPSLLGPLHPLTTSAHLLLPIPVPRPKASCPPCLPGSCPVGVWGLISSGSSPLAPPASAWAAFCSLWCSSGARLLSTALPGRVDPVLALPLHFHRQP